MKKFFFTLCCILTSVLGYAYDFEVDGIYYHIISYEDLTVGVTSKEISNGYAVTHYTGDIVIPSTVTFANRTFTVTEIEYPAFYESKELSSISLPNTIKKVEGSSFAYSGINEIRLPNSLEDISSFAFGYCPNLKKAVIEDSESPITFSDHNYSYVGIFRGCPLEQLYIGRNFAVDIPNTAYSPFGFHDISTIVNIELGKNVTTICKNMFAYCKSLTSFKVPETVIEIEESAFSNCTKLASIILPESLKSISSKAFYNCQSLEKISFPSQITNIANDMFNGCTNLTEVSFNIGLETIERNAFYACSNIEKIEFPARLNSIQSNAFGDCSKLSEIKVHNTTPPNITRDVFATPVFWTARLLVPSGASALYSDAIGWKEFDNISEMDSSDDDIKKFVLSLKISNGGNVEMFGTTYSGTSTSTTTKEGEDVTLLFTPDDGYELKSVIVNGIDVIEYVDNGSYTISSINQNTSIDVTFAELPVYLTIKSADNGTIAQEVEKGKAYSFVITPSEGWNIESVSFNGTNVTSQLDGNKYTTPAITTDSELNVVYKQNGASAVSSVSSESNVKVFASNGSLTIDNVGTSTTLSVYSSSGSMVVSESIGVGTTTIDLPTNNIYIIKVGEETYKFSM